MTPPESARRARDQRVPRVRALATAACLLLAPAALRAQPLSPAPRFERLPCGLRVCVVEERGLPLVSVQLWIRAGSIHDTPGRPGLCHLVNTLLAERDGVSSGLRASGARVEQGTLRDASYFATLMPAAWLDMALEAECARLAPLTATPAQIESARIGSVVRRAGAADRAGDIGAQADELTILSHLMADHPYRMPPEFVSQAAAGATPDDVQEFVERWYAPGNATLFIIGDVRTEDVLPRVTARFGGLAWRDSARRVELPPVASRPGDSTLENPLVISTKSPAQLEFHWLAPPRAGRRAAALDVLMQHLCNPVDGRLAARLAAAGFGPPTWWIDPWARGGRLTLRIPVSRPAAADVRAEARQAEVLTAEASAAVRRLVLDELQRTAKDVPGEIAFNRARNLAQGAIFARRAGFAERARALARAEMIDGDILLYELEPSRIQRLHVADLQSAAGRLLAEPCLMRSPARPMSSADAPRLVQAPPAVVAQQPASAPAAVGAHLAASGVAPPGDGGEFACMASSQPAAEISALPGGISLAVIRMPGATACVRAAATREEAMGLEQGLRRAGEGRPSAPVIDYLSYHGLTASVDLDPRQAALVLEGRVELTPQMIEIAAGLVGAARPAPSKPESLLIIAGDVSIDAARAAVERAWSGAVQPGARPRSSAEAPAASAPAAEEATISGSPAPSASSSGLRPSPSVTVRVVLNSRAGAAAAGVVDLLEELFVVSGSDGVVSPGYGSELRVLGDEEFEWSARWAAPFAEHEAGRLVAVARGWSWALRSLLSDVPPSGGVEEGWRRARVRRLLAEDSPFELAAALQRYGAETAARQRSPRALADLLDEVRAEGVVRRVFFESTGAPAFAEEIQALGDRP